MDFLMIDPRMDEHPDVEEAGFAATSVFQAILRAIARNDGQGRLRGKFASPRWLARRMNLQPDDIGANPEVWVETALQRCVTCGLIKREGEDYTIPGWERFYSPAKSPAVRSKEYRDRLKVEAEAVTERDERHITSRAVTDPVIRHATELNTTEPNRTQLPPQQAVISEAADFGSWWNRQREAKGLAPEPLDERKLTVWYAEAVAEVGQEGLKTASAAFLGDEYFRPRGWPLPVFQSPRVWRSRVGAGPAKPKQTSDPNNGIATRSGGTCTDCGGHAESKLWDDWVCYQCGSLRAVKEGKHAQEGIAR